MKILFIVVAALFAMPSAASEGRDRCSVRDLNGNWVYYSFSPSDRYAITCSLRISNGTINNGSCVQSSGPSFTSSGSLSFASAPAHDQSRRPQKTSDRAACSITGTVKINYPGINLTETLTNLTIADSKDEIVGVGTNSAHLISVNFVRSGSDGNDGADQGGHQR
jgi:hypothetical protein